MEGNRFNLRGLTSLLIAAGFLILTISGGVSYVVPHGRIAYWTDWSFLGLTKTNWADIHLIGSVLFLVAGAVHVYLNWKPLARYFMGRVKGSFSLKKEVGVTGLVALLVVLSAIYGIPPLSYIPDLGESAKNSWVSREYEPPFGRAELLSFKSFCKKQDIPLQKAIAELGINGILVRDPETTLAEAAKSNGTSPLRLYMIVKQLEGKAVPRVEATILTPEAVEEKFAGSGIGRKTFSEITRSMNLDVATVRNRMAFTNLEVKDDEPLKQAAERLGVQPIELLKAVMIEGYKPQK
jgi:hypothetical protein